MSLAGMLGAGTALASEGTSASDKASSAWTDKSASVSDEALQAMSLDELVSLRARIEKLLTERITVGGATMPAGEFLVGRDIAAGVYSFSPIVMHDDDGRIIDSDINIYDSIGKGGYTYRHVFTSWDENDTSCTYTLEDGNLLCLGDASFIVTPQVLPFAVPQEAEEPAK